MLRCISFWNDGKLVVIVHVIRLIYQFDGSGQGPSVWVLCSIDTRAPTHTKRQTWNRSVLFRVTQESAILIVCFVTNLLITSGRVVVCFFFLCHAASADIVESVKQRFSKWGFKTFKGLSVRVVQNGASIFFRESLIFQITCCLRCYVTSKVKTVMDLVSPGTKLIGSFRLLWTKLHCFRHHYHQSVSFGASLSDQALAMVLGWQVPFFIEPPKKSESLFSLTPP